MSVARKKAAETAAQALAELNMLGAIDRICQGSDLRLSQNAAFRIGRICRAEMQKRLRDYDRNIALAISP